MNCQNEIIKKLFEARRNPKLLNEAWPAILSKSKLHASDKYAIVRLKKQLIKAGLDIENTPVETVEITSNRDPRLRSDTKSVLIFVFKGFRDKEVPAVWFDGKIVIDCEVREYREYASRLSWKKLIDAATEMYMMTFDEDIYKALKAKQSSRKASQQGMVRRYRDGDPDRPHTKIDKSGYVVDTDKYKWMLAELQVANSEQVLERAKEVYLELAAAVNKVNWRQSDYESIVQNILYCFRTFDHALKDYNRAKDAGDMDREYAVYLKGPLVKAVRDLNGQIARAKKYLASLEGE